MDIISQLIGKELTYASHCGPAIVENVPQIHAGGGAARRVPSVHDFGIHLAATEAGRRSASSLVNRLYGQRGYGDSHQLEADPHRVTLAASGLGRTLGTVTLGLDSPSGILADEVFKAEIDQHRQRGARVAEVTKLGIDPGGHSQMALASLFHIVYLYAHKVYQCTDVFIEVNPRHRRFYETMMGFQSEGEVRTNPRVNAPAHLLRISLDYMEAQIERLAGSALPTGRERSLYPHFFATHEADAIRQRLMGPELKRSHSQTESKIASLFAR